MRRVITSAVAALGIAAGSVVLSPPATADVSPMLWAKVEQFNKLEDCENAGRSGERRGVWRAWWCEYNGGVEYIWTLWADFV